MEVIILILRCSSTVNSGTLDSCRENSVTASSSLTLYSEAFFTVKSESPLTPALEHPGFFEVLACRGTPQPGHTVALIRHMGHCLLDPFTDWTKLTLGDEVVQHLRVHDPVYWVENEDPTSHKCSLDLVDE